MIIGCRPIGRDVGGVDPRVGQEGRGRTGNPVGDVEIRQAGRLSLLDQIPHVDVVEESRGSPGRPDVREEGQLLAARDRGVEVGVEGTRRRLGEEAVAARPSEIIQEGLAVPRGHLVEVQPTPEVAPEGADIPRFDRKIAEPSAQLTGNTK